MIYTTKRKTIKYYKDVTGSTSWTRPNISTYNTWGGDKFAVKASSENSTNYIWKIFDGSDSTTGQTKATSGTVYFYNPVPLNVTQLNIVGYNNDWRIQNCTFSGSNDDIHYEVIATHSPYFKDLVWNTPNDKFFKYFKIDWQRYGSYGLMWKELKITATQQTESTIGVKEVPFTFPELTSEGSLGGDEYGVQALDDRVTGLMNIFQPLVDGKVQNGVYAEFPIVAYETVNLFKIYSPIPFKGFEIKIYKGLDENGAVSGIAFNQNWFFNFSNSNDDINYGFYSPSMGRQMSSLAFYFVEETDEYMLLRSRQPLIDEAGANKFWKFEVSAFKDGVVKIGKIEITGILDEPLTADDGYYQQDGKWENPKLTVSLTTNLVELIWNTDKGEYTTYVSSNGFSKAAVNDLLFQYTADGVSVQNPEFLVRKIGDSSTNALSYRLESQIYAVPEVIPNIVKIKTREYYKTVSNMTDWVQPVLTSNGTMGGDSFACVAGSEIDLGFGEGPNYAYYAFDNNANTSWWGKGSISWYNPVPLNILKIEISYYLWVTNVGLLQYSDNNSDWHTVASLSFASGSTTDTKNVVFDLGSNDVSAKYWRIYMEDDGGCTAYSIKITAQTGTTTTIDGTADDYDFYEDKVKTYTIRR